MPQFPFTPSFLPSFAAQGQARKLQQALNEGADPNGLDMAGDTAMHTVLGTRPGQTARMIAALVAAGADVNAQNVKGETPLTMALQRGCSVEHITALLDAGAHLERLNDDGVSPLSKAFLRNRYAAFDLLLERGAPWDARQPMAWTTLHHTASSTVDHRCTQALLNAGADPTVGDRFGRTAFDVARGANVAVLETWRAARQAEQERVALNETFSGDTAPSPRGRSRL